MALDDSTGLLQSRSREDSCADDSRNTSSLRELQPHELDVSQVIDQLGYGRFQRFLFVLCGLGWATDIGEVLVASFFVQSVSRSFGVTSEATKSLVASAPFLGMLLGAVVFGAMADRLGRRPAFVVTSMVTGAAGMFCAIAPSFEVFVLLRALVGFGLGGNLPIGMLALYSFLHHCRQHRLCWCVYLSIEYYSGIDTHTHT
jgi:putative MFS transporter